MKKIYLITSILILNTLVFASPYPRDYERNDAVIDFLEQPTLQNFEKIDPYFIDIALASVLVNPNYSPEHTAIINKYYVSAPPEKKISLNQRAFRTAVYEGKAASAQKYFSELLKVLPNLSETICSSMIGIGIREPDDTELDAIAIQASSAQIQVLQSVLNNNPNYLNTRCALRQENGQPGPSFSLQDLINLPSSQKLTTVIGMQRQISPSQSSTPSTAMCTEKQYRIHLGDSYYRLLEIKGPVLGLIGIVDGSCLILGELYKNEIEEFEFKAPFGVYKFKDLQTLLNQIFRPKK